MKLKKVIKYDHYTDVMIYTYNFLFNKIRKPKKHETIYASLRSNSQKANIYVKLKLHKDLPRWPQTESNPQSPIEKTFSQRKV